MKSICPKTTISLILLSGWASPLPGHPDPLENIKIYTHILAASPDNAYALLNRGICYRMVFDFDRSIADFDRAEELGITGEALWMNRAMSFLPRKDYDSALDDLDRVVEARPDDATNLFYRGEVYYRQGRYSEAIEDYTASLATRETAHVYYVRGDALAMLERYDEALEDLTRAAKMRPYTVGYRIARARLLGRMGRFEEAFEDLENAREKQPERYEVYVQRAVLSASRGLDASAEADLRTALKFVQDELFFRPESAAVYADRAKIQDLLGNSEEALDDLGKSIGYAPPNEPKFHRLRAELLRRLGRMKEAEEDLSAAELAKDRPYPTATPLPGPTLSLEELQVAPTPNLLPGLVEITPTPPSAATPAVPPASSD